MSCTDESNVEMGKAFQPGATCQQAASSGGCTTSEKVKSMCCKSCKLVGDGPPGSPITNDGTPFNPWSKDGCYDAPLAEMEAAFGPSSSCGHVVAMGQCNAGVKVKEMCCASCGGNKNQASSMNGGHTNAPLFDWQKETHRVDNERGKDSYVGNVW